MGYLSIWNCIDMMHIRCVSSIVNTFTMALRSYFASSKLAYVNRMLSGISMKDEMTGLYNRLGYHNMAPRLFKETHDAGGRLGILFIDMDKLKHINDSLGHAIGDQAIQCISNAILHSMPKDALPVRYGGDEFLVIAPIDGEEALRGFVDAIREAIPREAGDLGVTDPPGFSIGCVLTDPEAGMTLNEYVEEADSQMYADKKERKAER